MKRCLIFLSLLLLTACGREAAHEPPAPEASVPAAALAWDALAAEGSMPLQYADQFTVDYFQDGYKLLTVAGEERYLIVPEGAGIPAGTPADVPERKGVFVDIRSAHGSGSGGLWGVPGPGPEQRPEQRPPVRL